MLKNFKKLWVPKAQVISTPPPSNPLQEELNTRLAAAVLKEDAAAIRQAIQDGADIDAQAVFDTSGGQTTPLHLAASRGLAISAILLLEAGADVDKEDPLFFAAGPAIVKILLEAGATVDQQYKSLIDNGHRTPLHAAVNNGEVETAKLLLAAGADPSFIGGYYNDTPAQAAHRREHADFADVVQAVADDPATRPTPESVGLDMGKRIAALEARGKPLGPFTEAEKKRVAQRETREAQRQAALRGEGI